MAVNDCVETLRLDSELMEIVMVIVVAAFRATKLIVV